MRLSHYTHGPASGTFTAELATNRACSNLSYGGWYISEWEDGKQHPEDWNNSTTVPTRRHPYLERRRKCRLCYEVALPANEKVLEMDHRHTLLLKSNLNRN
jgi:hypothetical protein